MVYPTNVMSANRYMDRSLLLYLKETALVNNRYYSIINTEALTAVSGSTTEYESESSEWIYYNPDSTTLTNLNVAPTITGGDVDYIDYHQGRVNFTSAPTSPTASYSAQIVEAIDGFPEYDKYNEQSLPIISLDYIRKERDGLMLGGGFWIRRTYVLDIFAPTDGLRDDLMDRLEEQLKYNIKIYNYGSGFPLDYDQNGGNFGNINSGFNRDLVLYSAKVIDLNEEVVRVPSGGFMDRHRGKLTFTLQMQRGEPNA